MRTLAAMIVAVLAPLAFADAATAAAETQPARVPENVHHSEIVSYPGPWGFLIGRSSIILVSDDQLEALADPDRKINLSLSSTPQEESLREVCERARNAGHRTLIIAFDHFFAQYRPGQHKPRQLTPDKPAYVDLIARISKFAQEYGLGLELSLLSPLEIGPAYTAETGEGGIWMHYRKGVRDPKTGAYSVQLWRQRQWTNNKGTIEIADAGVRVFAFAEKRIWGTPYRVVDPAGIVDISDTAQVEVLAGEDQSGPLRVRIHGQGGQAPAGLDRVLVVQQYRTPEMDYFSANALPYLKKLVDRYVDAGVQLNALYSDEMHIQQDWGYHQHHDNGEFAVRYVSPGLGKRFAELYGEQYRDFAKYLIYFTYGQEDTATDLSAKQSVMHVLGASPEAIRETALMRAHYYRLLHNTVVDLFTDAKHYLEGRIGYRLDARAHATWAESPTCDLWAGGTLPATRAGYEYTPNYVWSNTVHQAASACDDYFKWGDFLTGNGNDHAEGGWLDRDYFGLALACSTGILNEVPYSYAAHWGMPHEVARRRHALVNTFGAAAQPFYGMVQDMEHRDVDVLMLYPLDLVAVEERFGSWMTQYGYANYITVAKLLERGTVRDGAIELAGRRFTTLVALFEPFPSRRLVDMMQHLADGGGRVVWSGPPPLIGADGQPLLSRWAEVFGVDCPAIESQGMIAPGSQVSFDGPFKPLAPMPILTDFLVDRVYPVFLREGTAAVARIQEYVIGGYRRTTAGGIATFLGFRPREDQAQSLGHDARWWFDILSAIGAYPPTGPFAGVNDNCEHLSRTSAWLTCRFPNGAVAIAPHLRDLRESWPGGFHRNNEEDAAIVKRLDLPSDDLKLQDFKVNGHTVSYEGKEAMTFRVNASKELIAFCGKACRAITVDGQTTNFADKPMPLVAWAPIPPACRADSSAVLRVFVYGTGTIRVPLAGASVSEVVAEGSTPGARGEKVPFQMSAGQLVLTLEQKHSGRWIYVLAPPNER